MLLAFDDEGPGPVVVLIHGFPLDRAIWAHQMATIGAIYRVIAPDLRGHGTSAAPEGVYTVDEMADDVLELLDGLQITGPVIFGGLSMGGYVVLSIAARHPERVKGLILVNTRSGADTPETAEIRRELASKVDSTEATSDVISTMLPKLFSRSSFEHHPALVARWHGRMERMTSRAVSGTLRGLASRPDRTGMLGEIQVPTLILAGSEDALISREESKSMAGSIPGAKLVVISQAGHLAPVENPEAVDVAILEFLQSLW